MENPQIVAMRKLGMTEEEIADVLKKDKEIDQGVKHFELTADQKQAEKKMRQAERTPTVYNFSKREQKKDDDKISLIALLAETVGTVGEDVEITNKQREIIFNFNSKKYKIVLSAPRS